MDKEKFLGKSPGILRIHFVPPLALLRVHDIYYKFFCLYTTAGGEKKLGVC